MRRKVLILPGSDSHSAISMFSKRGWEVVNNIEDADLVQFMGGDDVDPALYKQHRHTKTFFNAELDDEETNVYLRALELSIPCAGICRGGQLLHVLQGGEMWQDVNNHTSPHKAVVKGVEIPITVTSTHHQQFKLNHETQDKAIVLLTATEATKKRCMSDWGSSGPYEILRYIGNGFNKEEEDLEALYYEENNVLCFQPHPEYVTSSKECTDVYFSFIENYLFNHTKEEENV